MIEDMRRKGHSQTQIADMHGVSRQAVSWQKVTYGGQLTTRQIVNKAWPWETNKPQSKSVAYQRIRDHGEFMVTGGRGMSDDKVRRLKSWWRRLRSESIVLEFDPNIPPEPGVSPHGGFAYRPRLETDGDLLIRVNEFTKTDDKGQLSVEAGMIWRWPGDIEDLLN